MPVNNLPPFKKGQTCFIAVDRSGQPGGTTELYSSVDDAIAEYISISGDDPDFVLELRVTRIGGFTRQVKWD